MWRLVKTILFPVSVTSARLNLKSRWWHRAILALFFIAVVPALLWVLKTKNEGYNEDRRAYYLMFAAQERGCPLPVIVIDPFADDYGKFTSDAIAYPGEETIDSFADRIKKKYPRYKDLENLDLVREVLSECPKYRFYLNDEGLRRANQPALPAMSNRTERLYTGAAIAAVLLANYLLQGFYRVLLYIVFGSVRPE